MMEMLFKTLLPIICHVKKFKKNSLTRYGNLHFVSCDLQIGVKFENINNLDIILDFVV